MLKLPRFAAAVLLLLAPFLLRAQTSVPPNQVSAHKDAVSLFERSREHLGDNSDPNKNRFIREPGHVEYADGKGLGVFDNAKIKLKVIEL